MPNIGGRTGQLPPINETIKNSQNQQRAQTNDSDGAAEQEHSA